MSRIARREGLSGRHRFRGRDCFRPLLRSPRKLTGKLVVVHVGRCAGHGRFGIAVGRRSARSAVSRNLIKRRVRELFRRHPVKLGSIDVVATLTPRFAPEQVDALVAELGELLDRAQRLT